MALHTRQAIALLLVLLTSFAAVRTTPGAGSVAEWWIAAAIGACAMVFSPRRHVLFLFVSVGVLTWAGNYFGGRAASTAPFLGLANAVEAFAIAYLLTRGWARVPSLMSWSDLRRYVLVIAFSSLVPAAASVALSFSVLDRDVPVVAAWVFVNHLACNMVVMLLIVERSPLPRLSKAEMIAYLVLLLGVLGVTYTPNNAQSLAFLMTPAVVWAGARFPSTWAVAALMVMGGLITVFAQHGIGPFEVLSINASMVSVISGMQTFMAINVLIALVFATALALERERGLAMLEQQRKIEAATATALEREREANKRMQSIDHAKNELISTISHELRTPLTSIVGYVEMLEDSSELDERSRIDLLGRVSRNADRLLVLAKDVLRIAAADEQDFEPDKRLIDLRTCVTIAQDSALIPPERASEITVRVEVPGQEVPVHADPEEIERVVLNYVNNAIKFTPGTGDVCVALTTNGSTARIAVKDTGLGISRDEQDRLFERFYRTESARVHAVPGTGLGLSIARSIAEAHGGEVGFSSEEGNGSTFWIDLPLAVEGRPR